jgi:dCTP deaminase
MGLKNDLWIKRMALEQDMISPFVPKLVNVNPEGEHVLSFGLSSYGYDFRLAPEWRIFHNVYMPVVDPKAFDVRSFVELRGDECIIPPNSFILARTIEEFFIPRGVLTICVGKSSYARCGLILNVTPFEPEWRGYATIEISNTTPLPAKVYANEGAGQVLFFEADEMCSQSYADRNGKYQDQVGVVPARI